MLWAFLLTAEVASEVQLLGLAFVPSADDRNRRVGVGFWSTPDGDRNRRFSVGFWSTPDGDRNRRVWVGVWSTRGEVTPLLLSIGSGEAEGAVSTPGG